ncbi:hypothetical protein T484DRAFT_1925280 [Baffinella frigidus]|nr:hypothetical protein T484DRAFT_1925280 [Cryptophyta sp. CCMP2293]
MYASCPSGSRATSTTGLVRKHGHAPPSSPTRTALEPYGRPVPRTPGCLPTLVPIPLCLPYASFPAILLLPKTSREHGHALPSGPALGPRVEWVVAQSPLICQLKIGDPLHFPPMRLCAFPTSLAKIFFANMATHRPRALR